MHWIDKINKELQERRERNNTPEAREEQQLKLSQYRGMVSGNINKDSGHISKLGKKWGSIQGKNNTISHSTKVLGAKTMADKTSMKILQLDMEGNLIKEWNSINDAKREGFHAGHISECCNNKKPQYKGFKWEFKK